MRIQSLPEENLIQIMSYLRATDLSSCCLVDKSIFQKERIKEAIKYQFTVIYASYTSQSHENLFKKENIQFRPDYLYILEIKAILQALTSPSPLSGKGYYISTSWIANARKYYESLTLPQINNNNSQMKKSQTKKSQKIRSRRGSDALPPWPNINIDITCCHNNLSIVNRINPKTNRKLINTNYWKLLNNKYCNTNSYKYTITKECFECSNMLESETKSFKSMLISNNKETQISNPYKTIHPLLHSFYRRKNGVPNQCINKNFDNFIIENTNINTNENEKEYTTFAANISTSLTVTNTTIATNSTVTKSINTTTHTNTQMNYDYYDNTTRSETTIDDELLAYLLNNNHINSEEDIFDEIAYGQTTFQTNPLSNGLYTILPRKWCKLYRQYLQNPSSYPLQPLDNTCMLCPSHNKLIIPPHLDEYLNGYRKHLLAGLGTYPG